MKLTSKALLFSLVVLLIFAHVSSMAATVKKPVQKPKQTIVKTVNPTKAINTQIAAELKKKALDTKKLNVLFGKLTTTIKPKAYDKTYSLKLNDVDKDKIPEIFTLYSNSKKSTMNLTILKWDKKTSTYVSKFTKDLSDMQKAAIKPSSLFTTKIKQYLLEYETPKKIKGIMVLNYNNGSYTTVYSFKGYSFDIKNIDKDKLLEIGEVTSIPKSGNKLKRIWKKFDGKVFKQTKAETIVKKQYDTEIKKRNELAAKKQILAKQKAQKKVIVDDISKKLAVLKPKDYEKVDGYLLSDLSNDKYLLSALSNDKAQKLAAVYKKTSTGKDYILEIYKYNKEKSLFESIFSKEFICEKVTNLFASDLDQGGNLEIVLTVKTADNRLNLKAYKYDNGTISELTSVTTDVVKDFDNDDVIEIGNIKNDTTEWQKWDGEKFVAADANPESY